MDTLGIDVPWLGDILMVSTFYPKFNARVSPFAESSEERTLRVKHIADDLYFPTPGMRDEQALQMPVRKAWRAIINLRVLPQSRKQWTLAALGLGGVCAACSYLFLSMVRMPGESFRGRLDPLTQEQINLRDALRRHVTVLSQDIGSRHLYAPTGLDRAANYIVESFERSGYAARDQPFLADGRMGKNIEAERLGDNRPEEIVLIGAHYDTFGDCPGADDNASGVAGLLELARLCKDKASCRTIRFVAFANEEPPFFSTKGMGSRVYATRCRERGDRLIAMLSLESIGCYLDEQGSQKYPPPFGIFYPDAGDFIAFIGNMRSRDLVRTCVGAFRQMTQFPCEGAAIPGAVPGVGWSDHFSFWKQGYRAIMVTDTAPFRYPYYHTAADTADKLNYDRMARVVCGIRAVVEFLAE